METLFCGVLRSREEDVNTLT